MVKNNSITTICLLPYVLHGGVVDDEFSIPGVVLVANRDIKAGDELLCCYDDIKYEDDNERVNIVFNETDKNLISNIEKDAKQTFGMVQLFTVCGNTFLQDIHKKLDWFMMPAKYEAFKYL